MAGQLASTTRAGRQGRAQASTQGQEDDIDAPYLWSDLLARRTALAIRQEDLAAVLCVDEQKYRARETGALPVGQYLADELIAMEKFVADTAAVMIAGVPSVGRVAMQAVVDRDAFTATHPYARTLRDGVAYPLVLQHVAVGRAAGELSRRDRDVEVHRGARRADLTVRRLASGLEKNETAALLGVDKKHYYTWERGAKPPPVGLLAELQAIDDFIEATAGQLDVAEIGGNVSVVLMFDDQHRFEQAYPLARTRRDGVAYPVRVHRVAAARRAHALHAAGRSARIAVIDA